jgi:hypothetical protein
MSNNHKLAPMINDHLLIEEASGEYISNHRKLKKGSNHPASNITMISSSGE